MACSRSARQFFSPQWKNTVYSDPSSWEKEEGGNDY